MRFSHSMIRFQLRFLHHFIEVLLRFSHARTVSRSRFLHPVPLVHVLPVVRDVVSPRGVIRVRVTCIVFFGHGHPRFKTQESYMPRQPRKRGKAWATTSTPTSSGARGRTMHRLRPRGLPHKRSWSAPCRSRPEGRLCRSSSARGARGRPRGPGTP